MNSLRGSIITLLIDVASFLLTLSNSLINSLFVHRIIVIIVLIILAIVMIFFFLKNTNLLGRLLLSAIAIFSLGFFGQKVLSATPETPGSPAEQTVRDLLNNGKDTNSDSKNSELSVSSENIVEFTDGCIDSKYWYAHNAPIEKLGQKNCLQPDGIKAKTGIGLMVNIIGDTDEPKVGGISRLINDGETVTFSLKIKDYSTPVLNNGAFFIGTSNKAEIISSDIEEENGIYLFYRFFSDGSSSKLCTGKRMAEIWGKKNDFSTFLKDLKMTQIITISNVSGFITITDCIDGTKCISPIEDYPMEGPIYFWMGYYFPGNTDFSADISDFKISGSTPN